MAALRDRRRITHLVVLRELALAPGAPLRVVADALDVTVQAVSVHLRHLHADGLVARANGDGDARKGGYVLTAAGIQRLHEGFSDLKRDVDDTVARLAVVRVTSAMAAAPITTGARVGLFMEAGELVARPGRPGGSQGTAVNDAAIGEEVQVRDLTGVVDLAPGRLVVVRIPGPEEGGSRHVSVRRLTTLLRDRAVHADRTAAWGTPARALVRRLGDDVDLEFAPAEAAFHAAQMGLNVVLYVSRDLATDCLHLLDARNDDALEPVPVEVLDAPLLKTRPVRPMPLEGRP